LCTVVFLVSSEQLPFSNRRKHNVVFTNSYNKERIIRDVRGGNLVSENAEGILSSLTTSIHENNISIALHNNITKQNEDQITPCSIQFISVCSVQGKRQYMEDETYTNEEGGFAAVFDGHGGSAVSRYLRQNLYARYLQAKSNTNDLTVNNANDTIRSNDNNTSENVEVIVNDGDENVFDPLNNSVVSICTRSLENAFEKIDNEVQKISHWSFQGSTACVIKLCQVPVRNEDGRFRSVLISANVGDSRALLCRRGRAIDLTRDHKPNDPIERKRIENLGGEVVWCGQRDKYGNPIIRNKLGGFSGVYRINGNLALSRAIGDRSEKPLVCAKVDIEQWELNAKTDEFVMLATDGLWDVWSSQGVVDFCRHKLPPSNEKQPINESKTMEDIKRKMSKLIVKEALRRGSGDNISVIILWLSNNKDDLT
jgi:serine/threonine protein phosphatase PrpC